MARRLDLPHDCCWTGSLAAWAPFPLPSATAQQLAGAGLPPLKCGSRGVWLRSEGGGVVRVQWQPDGGTPLIVCTLRSRGELVSAPLKPGAFAYKLLCPHHTAGDAGTAPGPGSGHLLLLTLNAAGDSRGSSTGNTSSGGTHTGLTIAVRFDTAQAGRECGALLLAIQQGSLQLVQPAPPPPPAQWPQQLKGLRQGPGGKAVDGEIAGAGEAFSASGLFGYPDESSLAAAVQALRADPSFLAYVEQLEQAVERVEGLLL